MNKRSRQQMRAVDRVCTARMQAASHSPSQWMNCMGWKMGQYMRIGIENTRAGRLLYDAMRRGYAARAAKEDRHGTD